MMTSQQLAEACFFSSEKLYADGDERTEHMPMLHVLAGPEHKIVGHLDNLPWKERTTA